jgi:hypothetical protein
MKNKKQKIEMNAEAQKEIDKFFSHQIRVEAQKNRSKIKK